MTVPVSASAAVTAAAVGRAARAVVAEFRASGLPAASPAASPAAGPVGHELQRVGQRISVSPSGRCPAAARRAVRPAFADPAKPPEEHAADREHGKDHDEIHGGTPPAGAGRLGQGR
jgi:hypothetical protein